MYLFPICFPSNWYFHESGNATLKFYASDDARSLIYKTVHAMSFKYLCPINCIRRKASDLMAVEVEEVRHREHNGRYDTQDCQCPMHAQILVESAYRQHILGQKSQEITYGIPTTTIPPAATYRTSVKLASADAAKTSYASMIYCNVEIKTHRIPYPKKTLATKPDQYEILA